MKDNKSAYNSSVYDENIVSTLPYYREYHNQIIDLVKAAGMQKIDWLDTGCDLTGFSAADRVVGRATAFLYCLLGVSCVYARVMSRPAAQVLESSGIAWEAGELVEGIINRRGTGPCPFESAVLEIQTPEIALAAIRDKMARMEGR